MKLLFFHQHFYPETVGTSTRAVEIVEYLVNRGHEVTVITGIPSHPSTMANGEVTRKQPKHEQFRGATVHRVWTFGTSKPDTFWRRMLAYGTFMVLGGVKALFMAGPYEAMVAISPLPNGIAGLVVSKLRRWPLMFDVCDIWPDCAIAVGMLQNRALIASAFWVEKKIYHHARRIGVVTRGFTENIVHKGIAREKVTLLPDWVDPATYDSSRVPRDEFRRNYSLDGKYVVSFLGNFGLLMGLEAILETARLVKHRDPDVLFLFVGKGVALPMMEARIQQWDLTNVRIIPYQPREKVPGILAACDALIVTYMKNDITQITVPSKIYEYMSSERAIVAGVDGVIREIILDAKCGLVSANRDPEELAAHILYLKSHPQDAEAMGKRGRAYVKDHFTFEKVAADYERAVLETAARSS